MNFFDFPDAAIDVPISAFDQLLDWVSSLLNSSGQTAILQFNQPALLKDTSIEYGADDFACSDRRDPENGSARTPDRGAERTRDDEGGRLTAVKSPWMTIICGSSRGT